MRKVVLIIGLLLVSLPISAGIDSRYKLQQRLSKIDGFYGDFEQIVTTPEGKLIQKGKGQLWLKRPHFFNWKMVSPDEISIVSDGSTVWIYTVLLEQVTAMNLTDVMDNRLLLLLTSDGGHIWQDYAITGQGDRFIITPRNNRGQHFEIIIDDRGILRSFVIFEEDGQKSLYRFSRQRLANIANRLFKFILPDGVALDDQR